MNGARPKQPSRQPRFRKASFKAGPGPLGGSWILRRSGSHPAPSRTPCGGRARQPPADPSRRRSPPPCSPSWANPPAPRPSHHIYDDLGRECKPSRAAFLQRSGQPPGALTPLRPPPAMRRHPGFRSQELAVRGSVGSRLRSPGDAVELQEDRGGPSPLPRALPVTHLDASPSPGLRPTQ